MIDGKRVLAVIPARGGSKRVPRKNLREFRHQSLIKWAVDAAIRSRYLDIITVSTEDRVIREHSELWCKIIDRPPELATDDASCEDVMRHALTLHPADWIVLLQPTSPLRTVEDIDACIERAQIGYGCISVARSYPRQPNGAVYVCTAEYLAAHDFSYGALMKYVMDDERSLDINEEADFAA